MTNCYKAFRGFLHQFEEYSLMLIPMSKFGSFRICRLFQHGAHKAWFSLAMQHIRSYLVSRKSPVRKKFFCSQMHQILAKAAPWRSKMQTALRAYCLPV